MGAEKMFSGIGKICVAGISRGNGNKLINKQQSKGIYSVVQKVFPDGNGSIKVWNQRPITQAQTDEFIGAVKQYAPDVTIPFKSGDQVLVTRSKNKFITAATKDGKSLDIQYGLNTLV